MDKEALNKQNKAYRSTLKGARKRYYRELHTKLRSQRSKDPKEYWSIINKASRNDNKTGNITLENFMEHFKNLNVTESPMDKSNHEQVHEPFTDLPFNSPITREELCKMAKKLKNGKAGGPDLILNEFIKYSPTDMLNVICKYFNLVLDSGIVPKEWTVGLIIPIYKNKGDLDDPDNYRGITLLSCMSKLFTMIINKRLSDFLEDNKLLVEEQAGFRDGYSTLDHIFSLHCIIDSFLSAKKRLYCAFIDYRKAFDSVDRSSLWQKLTKLNIKGKVLTVVQNLYNSAKSQVRLNNSISDSFNCNVGVRQGENLSSLLFAIYLNDLESFLAETAKGIDCSVGDNETQIMIKS